MPELPEVQTVLDGLVSVLDQRVISAVEGYYPGTLIRDPMIGAEPFPARMIQALRRGKYMIVNLDNLHSLIIHLRMTGKLVYDPNPEDIHKHERARIILEGGDVLRFIDPRTFGKISIVKTANLANYMPALGPEPLSDDFDARYLHGSIHSRKAPIKTLLLDQSLVAGLGNIYVCELLYRSGIRPDTPGHRISQKQARIMVKHTKDVLAEALSVGGTSISDYRRIDDKTGEFQQFLQVYQKQQCPLGHDLANIRLGGRSSFYCPICQK